jgi:hypothetical protein
VVRVAHRGLVDSDLVLRLPCGTVLEHDPATPFGADWTYTAMLNAPPGQPLTIEAIAKDRPGNEARETSVYP